jgi:hypothetical protein
MAKCALLLSVEQRFFSLFPLPESKGMVSELWEKKGRVWG